MAPQWLRTSLGNRATAIAARYGPPSARSEAGSEAIRPSRADMSAADISAETRNGNTE